MKGEESVNRRMDFWIFWESTMMIAWFWASHDNFWGITPLDVVKYSTPFELV
jgi:hypothetical protein